MGPYLGDFLAGQSVHFTWDTNSAAGASITRATNGTVSVYKDNGTTQTTTGVTDTEDFDSLTGVHACTIATTDAFYVPGSNYSVVLSAATIDGQTVNATLAHFSIQNRYVPGLITRGTAQGGAAGNIQLAAALAFGDDILNGATVGIIFGTGTGQQRVIGDYTSATDTADVSPNWTTNPDSTSVYEVYRTPPAPTATTAQPSVNVAQWNGTAVASPATAGYPAVTLKVGTGTGEVNLSSGAVPVGSIANGAITAAAIATDAIDADALASDAVTEIQSGLATASALATVDGNVDSILADTGTDGVVVAAGTQVDLVDAPNATAITAIQAGLATPASILTTALTESYAADGAAGTLSQILFGLQAFLQEKSVSGTTLTVKKVDGSTTAMTFTLSDASDPTSITRAS